MKPTLPPDILSALEYVAIRAYRQALEDQKAGKSKLEENLKVWQEDVAKFLPNYSNVAQ